MKMKLFISTILFCFPMILICQNTYYQAFSLMGCSFDITVLANNEEEGQRYIDLAKNEMKRIEKLISSWDPNSQTSLINKNAGIKPVRVDKELFDLIERAVKISQITDGAFDISFASLDKIWVFDGSMQKLPSETDIKNSISKIGFENIKMDRNEMTVFLTESGMKIGFGAIGKGYAADMAKQLLINKKVAGGIINASGDMNTWGKQENGEEWNIAITNPLNKEKIFALLPISNQAIVTSGDYEKYVEIDGQRHSHIINPKTGYPTKGIISVSVMADSAELADALATSIFVMGKEVGIHLVNQLPNIECIIVDDSGKVFFSDHIKNKEYEEN